MNMAEYSIRELHGVMGNTNSDTLVAFREGESGIYIESKGGFSIFFRPAAARKLARQLYAIIGRVERRIAFDEKAKTQGSVKK